MTTLDERLAAIQSLLEQLVRAAGREPVTCPSHLELAARYGWDKKAKPATFSATKAVIRR